jgi:hypothetical protein
VEAPAACIFTSSKCGCKRRKKSERRFGSRIHASATLLSAPADTRAHTINGGPAAVVAEELLERVARHEHARDEEEAFQSVTLSCLHRYLCAKSGAE